MDQGEALTCDYALTLDEFWRANRDHRLARPYSKWARLRPYLVIFVFLNGFALLHWKSAALLLPIVNVILVLAFLAVWGIDKCRGYPKRPMSRTRKSFLRSAYANALMHHELSEAEVRMNLTNQQVIWDWRAFVGAMETPRGFVLLLPGSAYVWLPKSGFRDAGRVTEARYLIVRRLSPIQLVQRDN